MDMNQCEVQRNNGNVDCIFNHQHQVFKSEKKLTV